jgi:hypothetical protein
MKKQKLTKESLMPDKIKITELKKALVNLERKDIERLICDLYKSNNLAESIISSYLLGDKYQAQLLDEYKEKMDSVYFPDNLSKGFSQRAAKNLISEYKKISANPQYILDLMLYYVECGTGFTNTYGDIDMRFYNSLLGVFDDFIMQIEKHPDEKMYLVFRERLLVLTYEVRNIGWGYGDYIIEEVSRLEHEYMEEE